MTDLSTDAQALHQALVSEAEGFANSSSRVGYAFFRAERVGGVERVKDAIDELNNAGVAVSVSAGEFERIIQLDGVRLSSRAAA